MVPYITVPIFSYSSITLLLKPSILECQTYCEHDENYYVMLQVKQKQVEISHLCGGGGGGLH